MLSFKLSRLHATPTVYLGIPAWCIFKDMHFLLIQLS